MWIIKSRSAQLKGRIFNIVLPKAKATHGAPPPTTGAAAQVNNSHLPQILGIQTAVLVLAITCVSLRLYVRIKMIKSTGRDDWTMAGAAVRYVLFSLADREL